MRCCPHLDAAARCAAKFLRRHGGLTLLSAVALLLPWAVLAQAQESTGAFDPGRLEPVQGDVSVTLLRGILGSVVDKIRFAATVGASDQGPFGGLFSVFNGFLLLMLGLVLFVKLVAALLDTAHEGEALGQDRSTTWTPLRIFLAAGMLVPLANGYSLLQVGVLWVTLSGIGLADAVWEKAVDQFQSTTLYRQPPPPQARHLAVALLASNVCERVIADLPARGSARYAVTYRSEAGERGTLSERLTRWSVAGLGEAACGGFVIREPHRGLNPGANSGSLVDDFLRWVNSLLGFGDEVREEFSAALMNAHELATLALRDELKPLAESIVAGKGNLNECTVTSTSTLAGSACLSLLDAAAEHYVIRLQSLVVGAVNAAGHRAFTEFSARAKVEGWLTAGSWFYRLAALTDYMNKLALNVPEPYPIRVWEKLPREDVETYAHLIKRLEAVVLEAESDGGLGLTRGDPNNGALDDVTRGWLRATLDWITQALFGTAHPLFAIAWIGHALIAVVLAAVGLVGVGQLVVSTTGAGRLAEALGGLTDLIAGQRVSGLASLAGLVIGAILLALLAFALLAAIYIPLVPFIIWTVAVLHWLLLVFEALLAAPLWAIWHLKNGKGLTAETMNGWLLLFALLLRPTLMVVGLLGATVVSYYLLSMIGGLFVVAAINAASGNLTGPVVIAGLVVVFVLLAVDLTLKTFSLIHRLPDFVLRWIGGAMENALDAHELRMRSEAAARSAVDTALRVAGQAKTGAIGSSGRVPKLKPMSLDKDPSS